MTNYYLKLTEFTDLNVITEPHSDMTIHNPMLYMGYLAQ